MYTATIHVYLIGGTIHRYDIQADTKWDLGAKAREHTAAIIMNGFRANSGKGEFTWFGKHWIDKIKVTGAPIYTIYSTQPTGT